MRNILSLHSFSLNPALVSKQESSAYQVHEDDDLSVLLFAYLVYVASLYNQFFSHIDNKLRLLIFIVYHKEIRFLRVYCIPYLI